MFYCSYRDQTCAYICVCDSAPVCFLLILCRKEQSVQKTPSFSYHRLQFQEKDSFNHCVIDKTSHGNRKGSAVAWLHKPCFTFSFLKHKLRHSAMNHFNSVFCLWHFQILFTTSGFPLLPELTPQLQLKLQHTKVTSSMASQGSTCLHLKHLPKACTNLLITFDSSCTSGTLTLS